MKNESGNNLFRLFHLRPIILYSAAYTPSLSISLSRYPYSNEVLRAPITLYRARERVYYHGNGSENEQNECQLDNTSVSLPLIAYASTRPRRATYLHHARRTFVSAGCFAGRYMYGLRTSLNRLARNYEIVND